MPYRSEKQRRFMHAAHPGIAARWDREYGGAIVASPSKKMPHDAYREAYHRIASEHRQHRPKKKAAPKARGMGSRFAHIGPSHLR